MLSRFIAQWRAIPTLTPLLLILMGVPATLYSTTTSMAEIWLTNETFTHGFLVLPISLWLIWGERERISQVPLHRDYRALIFLLPALALWLLASLIDVAVVQQLSMVAIVQLSVWLLLGYRLALTILFPLLYLFFAVPLGQSLIDPMMEFTADFTVYMVQLSGVPIFRDGLSFQLPSGNWSVVEECSGVRYLIASAALGTIYAYITYSSTKKRALFILASLIVPIIANGFRAYGIVMIGHLSGMKYAVGADHLLYGWVFFGIVIFILFWIGGFWADSPQESHDSTAATVTTALQPRTAVGTVGVIASLLALNLAVDLHKTQEVSLPADANIQLPTALGEWQLVQVPNKGATAMHNSQWSPQIHNPDVMLLSRYVSGAQSVTLHIGYFHAQRDGAEAISSLNKLTDPYNGDWKLTASRSISTAHGSINEAEVNYGTGKRLVWSGYIVGPNFVANPYLAKLRQVQALVMGRPEAAYITLSTPYDASLDVLRARLDNFWAAVESPLGNEVHRLGKNK